MRRSERGRETTPPPASSGSRGLTNGNPVNLAGDRLGRVNGLGRGRVNGLTNGLTDGLTNGLTNGSRSSSRSGLTNGMTNGLTNGLTNGFVNGAGAVNGYRISAGSRRISKRPTDVRKKMLMVAALVAIIMVIPYALVYAFPPAEVEIDGYFMDWRRATVYEDSPDSENPDVSISAYAVKADVRGSYFYIATAGTVMNGADGGADGFYIFVDRDGDEGTGYLVRNMGADHLIAVVGWDGAVALTATYVFGSSASQDDYAGFERSSDPLVAFKDGEIEIGAGLVTGPMSKVAVLTRHTNVSDDWSEVNFAYSGPAVRVLQHFVVPEVTTGYTDERMLTLDLITKGSRAELEGLRFVLDGNATPTDVKVMHGSELLGSGTDGEIMFSGPLRLKADETVRVSVLASFQEGSDTQSFGLRLDESSGLMFASNTTYALESYQEGAMMTYIVEAPVDISVDGAFADWQHMVRTEDMLGDVVMNGTGPFVNRDVDISSVVTWSSEAVSYLYMSVDGRMLGGSSVPGALVRWAEPPEPGGSMPNITEDRHLFGADFAYAFIDLDGNESTGFRIGGAESAVTVVGKNGQVMSANAYAYLNGSWLLAGPVDAAVDDYRLEIGASFEALGMSAGEVYRVTFMAQDWRGSEDTAVAALPARILADARSFGGIVINEVYSSVPALSNDWVELYNTASMPIDISGWRIYADGVLKYTIPAGTILGSGAFFVTPDLDFAKARAYTLTDQYGNVIDSVTLPSWMSRSYGRTGSPDSDYDTWAWMVPTPGEINQGQIPIPEFGDIIAPLAIVPIIFFVIRRTRGVRENARGDSEGNNDGNT